MSVSSIARPGPWPSPHISAVCWAVGLCAWLGAAQGQPALDARGRVDVWALRSAVAPVEASQPVTDPDRCEPEGDGEKTTAAQAREMARSARACLAKARREQQAHDALRARFNAVWRPLLRQAIAGGDLVAEVIWRQCSTTGALDRAGLESTCDELPARRAVATRRLREIGFEPAFDWAGEPAIPPGRDERRLVQAQVLLRQAAGDLGGYQIAVHHGGNAPATPAELDEIRNAMVIDTVLQEARRAFSLNPGRGDGLGALGDLRLNRVPTTPGLFTLGPLVYSGGNSVYDGRHDWRAGPQLLYLHFDERRDARSGQQRPRELRAGDLGDAVFLARVRDTLAAAEARIDHWLRQDERWAVFLLQRVGWHEWVPERQPTRSAQLDPAWSGEWTLVRSFTDLAPEAVVPARARILSGPGGSWLQFDTDPGSGQAAVACRLRYSGGLSLRPDGGQLDGQSTGTALGYLPDLTRAVGAGAAYPVQPFEPLDPRKHYKQVLVQCPQGEWPSHRRARQLFLAGDTLLEMQRELVGRAPLLIRHWRRSPAGGVAWPPLPALADEPGVAALIARFDHFARQAQAQRLEERLPQATVAELLDLLATWRVESRWYAGWALPEPLARLVELPGAAMAACQRLAARPADAWLRFNLVLVVRQLAWRERVAESDQPAAAACLRDAAADDEPVVRAEALWGLAMLHRPEDAELLRTRQADADAWVVKTARAALVELQRPQAERRR